MKVMRAKPQHAKKISDLYGLFYFVSDVDVKRNIKNIVVLEMDKKIVGMLACDAKHTTVKMIAIEKNKRDNGLGERLFYEGCELLGLIIDGMVVEATLAPTNSTHFWKKIGFKPVRELTTKRGNKMLVMEKKK